MLETSIDGAEQVLLNITGGLDMTLFEAQDASDIVTNAASGDVNIILGTSINEDLGDEIRVTVIATGIDESKRIENRTVKQDKRFNQCNKQLNLWKWINQNHKKKQVLLAIGIFAENKIRQKLMNLH